MELIIVLCLITLATSKVTLQGFYSKTHISTFADSIFFNGIIFLFSALIFVYALNCSYQVIIFGATFAIMTVLFQLCYIQAMSCGNVSLTVLVVNSSMIMPLLVSAIFFNEQFGVLKICGILAVFIALVFSVELKEKGLAHKKWLLLSVSSFFLNGGLAICQQMFGNSVWRNESVSFVAWSYLIATFISFASYFVTYLKRKIKLYRINYHAIGYGMSAGVILGIFQLLNTKAISTIDAGFLFPVYNGGTLIFTTISSVIFLKDKLRLKHIIAILIGIVGIVLINL